MARSVPKDVIAIETRGWLFSGPGPSLLEEGAFGD